MKNRVPMALAKAFFLFITCLASFITINAQNLNDVRLKFAGFGDIIYGQPFGKLANPSSAELFNKYGNDEYPTGMHKGFELHGFDMLGTASFKEHLKFQTELNFEGSRGADGGQPDLEVERMFLDYSISDKFGVQVGLIFTPIGYINRTLYSRAWLMNSLRFYQAVETSAGLIPNHFLGATAYGSFVVSDNSALEYMIGLGKARGKTPTEENFNNDDPGYQTAGLLTWHRTGASSDLQIAISGFSNHIYTFNVPELGQVVDIKDSSSKQLVLQEVGFNPYIKYSNKLLDFLAEYDYVDMFVNKGKIGDGTTHLSGLSAELAINTKVKGKRLAPYVRYEYVTLPQNEGPYYGLREVSDDELTKSYSPNMKTLLAGVAYDVSSHNRLKIEYAYNFDGAFQSNGIFVQTSFGF